MFNKKEIEKLKAQVKVLTETVGEEKREKDKPINFIDLYFGKSWDWNFDKPTLLKRVEKIEKAIERLEKLEKHLGIEYKEENKEFKGYKAIPKKNKR